MTRMCQGSFLYLPCRSCAFIRLTVYHIQILMTTPSCRHFARVRVCLIARGKAYLRVLGETLSRGRGRWRKACCTAAMSLLPWRPHTAPTPPRLFPAKHRTLRERTARFLLCLANSSLERDSQKPSQEPETATVQRLGMSLGFCF